MRVEEARQGPSLRASRDREKRCTSRACFLAVRQLESFHYCRRRPLVVCSPHVPQSFTGSRSVLLHAHAEPNMKIRIAAALFIFLLINSGYIAAYPAASLRSEERRVGKECRSRWSPYP